MSNTVGIRELRQQTSRVLKRVVAGEIVEITEHGHPIARIVPLRPGVLDQLTAEGRATEADSDLLDLLDELSSGCPPPQTTTTPAAPGGTSQRPAFETSTPGADYVRTPQARGQSHRIHDQPRSNSAP